MTTITTPFNSIEVQVDGQTRESWSDILSQFADASIYQTWAYGAIRWGARSLSHLVMRRDGEILAAAQLRIARIPLLPAGVAYLRWGPLCHRKGHALAPATVVEMVVRLREEYCKRRGLTLQLLPNAYPGDARGIAYEEALVQSSMRSEPIAPRYRTLVVDLAPAADVMRKRLNQKWRNQLNRSEKNGLALEVSDDHNAYREFMRLYESMWERKRFETSVDVEEFDRIQALLSGTARMQTFIARKDGQSIAALVCSFMGDSAIYLLGATNERARELKAAYFLQWQAMMWLKDRGARWYDLGGIDPDANPGGHHFKSGMDGLDVTQVPAHTCPGCWLSRLVTAFISWRHRASVAPKPATPSPAVASSSPHLQS